MPLTESPAEYFLPGRQDTLILWMKQAEEAIAVRQAAIRESFAQARYNNLKNLRKLKKEAHGVLDQCTIQNA